MGSSTSKKWVSRSKSAWLFVFDLCQNPSVKHGLRVIFCCFKRLLCPPLSSYVKGGMPQRVGSCSVGVKRIAPVVSLMPSFSALSIFLRCRLSDHIGQQYSALE